MSAKKTPTSTPAPPRTLWEAHQAVMAARPNRNASTEIWHSFRSNAAEIYSTVADVDAPHRDEALYWANSERARADSLGRHMKAGAPR